MRTLREELLDLEEATMMTTNELTPYDVIEQMDIDKDMEAIVLEINNTSNNISKVSDMANRLEAIDIESVDSIALGKVIFDLESMAEELGVDIEEDKPSMLKKIKDASVKAVEYLLNKLSELWRRFKSLFKKKAVKNALDVNKVKEKENIDLSGINKHNALFKICEAGNIDIFANDCSIINDFINNLDDLGKPGELDKAMVSAKIGKDGYKLQSTIDNKITFMEVKSGFGVYPDIHGFDTFEVKDDLTNWFTNTYKGRLVEVYNSISASNERIYENVEDAIDDINEKLENINKILKHGNGRVTLEEFGLTHPNEALEFSPRNNAKILGTVAEIASGYNTGLMHMSKILADVTTIIKNNIEDK